MPGCAAGEGLVGEDGGFGCGQEMEVCCAAEVVAWEEGVELDDAVRVGLLGAAAVGGSEIALARGGDARVDAG